MHFIEEGGGDELFVLFLLCLIVHGAIEAWMDISINIDVCICVCR